MSFVEKIYKINTQLSLNFWETLLPKIEKALGEIMRFEKFSHRINFYERAIIINGPRDFHIRDRYKNEYFNIYDAEEFVVKLATVALETKYEHDLSNIQDCDIIVNFINLVMSTLLNTPEKE